MNYSAAPTITYPRTERYLLISGDFVRTGGMDMANYFLADFLVRQGVPVHIVAHCVELDLLAHPNVTFHRAPRPRRSTLTGEPMLRFLGRRIARKLGDTAAGTRTVVNGGNCDLPDINWVHYLHAANRPVSGGSFLRRTKVQFAHRWFQSTERKALRRARLILANSRRTKADLVRCYGLDESIIHTVYYGTDPSTFCPAGPEEKAALRTALQLPAEKFLLVFIGALGDRRKGFDTLFEAWKNVEKEVGGQAELLVIGSGAELPRWQQLAAQSTVGRTIRFLGFRRDVPMILRAGDAFVAPTRYEAFGLAVLEALCCGLPALVSREAGVAEHYPAALDELMLDDPDSVSELTGKLRRLFEEREQWSKNIRPISEALRTYHWENMSQSIFEIITTR